MEVKYGRVPVNHPEEIPSSGAARFNNLFLDNTDAFKLKRKDKFGNVLPVHTDLELFTCGEQISGGRALALINGMVYHFQPGDLSHFEKCIGISTQAGHIGEIIDVSIKGQLANLGEFLMADKTIYSGDNGVLTDEEPRSGYILQAVGQAKDAGTLFIEVSPPFILS